MSEVLEFACRNDFRNWLRENCLSDAGVWLLFGKPGGPQTVKADEALEEALCFGWIDGQMKRLPLWLLCWKPMNLPSLIFRPCRRPSKRLIRVLIWMQKQRPDGRNAWLG